MIDVCGTGGDGAHTLNISTAVAFVAAGGGLKVAKHGTPGQCRPSQGHRMCWSALGVSTSTPRSGPERGGPSQTGRGSVSCSPRRIIGRMRHVMPVREQLGFRTIFNILGPLSNPANARRQVLGVFSPRWVEPLARVLGALGATRAWVVHGDGLDEITTTGSTQVAEWREGGLRLFNITPEAVGLPRAALADLRGGDPRHNADALRALLQGAPGAYRDVVLLNAAAALLVSERVETLREGVDLASEAIDNGAAARALDMMIEVTNTP